MANGESCLECGHQETTHGRPDYAVDPSSVCGEFKSPTEHHKDCPHVGCNGDCEATRRANEWRATCAENRARNMVFFTTKGNIAVVDIGT